MLLIPKLIIPIFIKDLHYGFLYANNSSNFLYPNCFIMKLQQYLCQKNYIVTKVHPHFPFEFIPPP